MKKIISIILALLCALTCMSMFGCGNKDREGVIDIEAGENLYPDEIVTRDFAASTLNFCLGYQLEDATYSFSDSESVTDADSAQIAIPAAQSSGEGTGVER